MSDFSHHHLAERNHPAWCVRDGSCTTGGETIWHHGAALSWTTAHVSVNLQLIRRDGAHYPGFARTDIALVLLNASDEGIHLEVPPGEVRIIAKRLLVLADLADATALSKTQTW
jgi:hypothetical protein